jgi:hypothetical protein
LREGFDVGSGAEGICVPVRLVGYKNGSGICLPLIPNFLSLSGLQLYQKKKKKKKSAELETSGSFLRLKTKQTNKKEQSWLCAHSMTALNSPKHAHACHDSW